MKTSIKRCLTEEFAIYKMVAIAKPNNAAQIMEKLGE